MQKEIRSEGKKEINYLLSYYFNLFQFIIPNYIKTLFHIQNIHISFFTLYVLLIGCF